MIISLITSTENSWKDYHLQGKVKKIIENTYTVSNGKTHNTCKQEIRFDNTGFCIEITRTFPLEGKTSVQKLKKQELNKIIEERFINNKHVETAQKVFKVLSKDKTEELIYINKNLNIRKLYITHRKEEKAIHNFYRSYGENKPIIETYKYSFSSENRIISMQHKATDGVLITQEYTYLDAFGNWTQASINFEIAGNTHKGHSERELIYY